MNCLQPASDALLKFSDCSLAYNFANTLKLAENYSQTPSPLGRGSVNHVCLCKIVPFKRVGYYSTRLLRDTPLRYGSGVSRSACLSVCLSVCPRAYLWNCWTDRHKFCEQNPRGRRSVSSGGVAISYALPVIWMTSRLAVVGRMAMRGRLNL